MLDTSQQWNLFGLDLTQAGHYLRSGWREFLWEPGSPVLAAVDEVVVVRQLGEQDSYYRAGHRVTGDNASRNASCTAILLPDALALGKELEIPLAAESELESVIALEINSSSPFTPEDTAAGWLVTGSTDSHLLVSLVISSRSAVMAHVGEHFDSHDVQAQEIWAATRSGPQLADGHPFVVLSGFGESTRRKNNAGRMRSLAARIGFCLLALVLIAGLAAFGKYLELQRVESMYAEAQSQSESSLQLREQLAEAKVVIAQAQQLTDSYPPPLPEFMRLTKMLGDDTWLSAAKVEGRRIRIEGESGNAAAVMQQLLDDDAYAKVDAVSAFKKVRSGMERFALQLVTADGEQFQ